MLLDLKVKEGSTWIDEFNITESDLTFKYDYKGYNLDCSQVNHIKIEGNRDFIKTYYGFKRAAPFFGKKSGAWKNEAFQRNRACQINQIDDDDIIILSDIDEIIDSRYATDLIELVKKHKIITIKLRFTMFFMNLFSTNWHEVFTYTPRDYAYRVFLIEGGYFKKMRFTSNKLRRLGEGGKLSSTVFCFDQFAGFHYSWLGGYKSALNKINAYAHDLKDHGNEIVDSSDVEEYIKQKILNSESIFDNHKLEITPADACPKLESIERNYQEYASYFI